MKSPKAIAISSDGSYVAIASPTEIRIKLYDIQSSYPKLTLVGSSKDVEANPISKLLFSPQNDFLLARVSTSNTLVVWDINRAVEAYRIQIPDAMRLCDVVLRKTSFAGLVMGQQPSSDGSIGNKYFVLEYDVSNGKLERKIKVGANTASSNLDVQSTTESIIQYSPLKDQYAILINKEVRVLQSEDGKRISKIFVSDSMNFRRLLEFSSHGSHLFYCRNHKEITVHTIENISGEEPSLLLAEEMKKCVDIASMSQYNDVFIIKNIDGTITLLSLDGEGKIFAKESFSISVQKGTILKAIFHPRMPDKKLLIVVFSDPNIYFESVSYRSAEDGSIILKKKHIVGMLAHEKSEEEDETRVAKKAKYDNDSKSLNEFEINNNELTIAERLQALKKVQNDAVVSDNDDHDHDHDHDDSKKLETELISQEPNLELNSKAFSALLSQILQSNDDDTLEHNILKSKSSGNRIMISNSIASLSAHQSNVLLCKIIQRLVLHPSRLGMNSILMNWMQAVLIRLHQIHRGNNQKKGIEDQESESGGEGRRALYLLRNMIKERVANMEGLTDLDARLALLAGDI